MTTPSDEILERQAEDMFGRPTGPRHEELGARPHIPEGAPRPAEEEPQPKRAEPEEERRSPRGDPEEQARRIVSPPY
ncbi:MAG: hypothetical protein L0Y66_11775 [Myxococcaceae bacterium]|nr:hypothetical protein [Myxococcaceae bacterium]